MSETTREKNSAEIAVSATLPLREGVLAATHVAVQQLLDDLSSLPVDAWSRQACGVWSVDQTVAHLALGPIAYAEIVDQITLGGREALFDPTDPGFAEAQEVLMGQAEPADRLDALESAFQQFADTVRGIPTGMLGQLTWTPEGVMPAVAALGIGLNELIVHGFDIRRAAGSDPRLRTVGFDALGGFAIHALAGLVRRGGWSAIGVSVRGMEPVVLSWDTDRVVLEPRNARDPVATLECEAAVLSLLTWRRLSLDEARRRYGLIIRGHEEDAVAKLLAGTRPF